MTAIGSHEYFYSLRGAQPPGEGISQKGRDTSASSDRAPAGISPGFFTPLLHFGRVYDILFPDKMQYFVREYGCFSLREYGRIGECGSDCLDSGRSVRAFTT